MLTAFCLADEVMAAMVIVPDVLGGLAIEQPDKREAAVGERHGMQAAQHRVAGDSVVGTDAVNGYHCVGRVRVCGRCNGVHDSFSASSGGQGELVRGARAVDGPRKDLRQAAGHQTPENVADDDPADPAVWFLECDDPP